MKFCTGTIVQDGTHYGSQSTHLAEERHIDGAPRVRAPVHDAAKEVGRQYAEYCKERRSTDNATSLAAGGGD